MLIHSNCWLRPPAVASTCRQRTSFMGAASASPRISCDFSRRRAPLASKCEREYTVYSQHPILLQIFQTVAMTLSRNATNSSCADLICTLLTRERDNEFPRPKIIDDKTNLPNERPTIDLPSYPLRSKRANTTLITAFN